MIIDAPARTQIPALRALWKEAFGDPDAFLDAFFATAFSPDRCRIAVLDGKTAAALYWFRCRHENTDVAYLYAVATAKAYRGQGICHTLMDDTHRHLKDRGFAGAVLVPGSRDLFRFYEKMGYKTCSFVREFSVSAAEDSVPVRRIEADEYAALRRQFLPTGGIAQKAENLLFLETQANLFAGQGFVLAARQEAGRLHCIELLGDETAAPNIVTALGCKSGTFRTPGDGRPFAMYLPFTDDPPPAYFGLAFD